MEGAALIDATTHRDAKGALCTRAATRPGADLARRLAAGGADALDELVALYTPRLTRLVHRLLGWRRDGVEDVVQEVFLAALINAKRFRGESSLDTWLSSIAVNKCRSRQRRYRLLWDRWVGCPRAPAPAPADAPSRDAPIGHGLALNETAGKVREAVGALSPRDREVVVLRYFDELSAAEIAEATGQSRNSVEVRLHRARGRLAEALRDFWDEGHS